MNLWLKHRFNLVLYLVEVKNWPGALVELYLGFTMAGWKQSEEVLNLSKNGMYITTAATSICDYSNIELSIYQTGISATPLHFSATVIYSDEQGIGVMYDENQQLCKKILQPFNNPDYSHQLFSTAC